MLSDVSSIMKTALLALWRLTLAATGAGRFGGAPGESRVYKTFTGKERTMELYLPPNHDPAVAKVPGSTIRVTRRASILVPAP